MTKWFRPHGGELLQPHQQDRHPRRASGRERRDRPRMGEGEEIRTCRHRGTRTRRHRLASRCPEAPGLKAVSPDSPPQGGLSREPDSASTLPLPQHSLCRRVFRGCFAWWKAQALRPAGDFLERTSLRPVRASLFFLHPGFVRFSFAFSSTGPDDRPSTFLRPDPDKEFSWPSCSLRPAPVQHVFLICLPPADFPLTSGYARGHCLSVFSSNFTFSVVTGLIALSEF